MKNAQKEFLQFTRFRKVKAAHFTVNKVQCNLRVGHTPEDYEEFLRKLDILYDCEDLYAVMGYIWFEEEDTWGERTPYGEWVLCWKPEIPNHLNPLSGNEMWSEVPDAKYTRRLC
jgi:hypothetical protein